MSETAAITLAGQARPSFDSGPAARAQEERGLPRSGIGTAPSALLVVARSGAIIAALAAVGIVHVWSHTRVTAAGYRLGELQRAQESLRAQRDRLEVEVATLRAPGRLEEFARTRLKMAPPAAGAVVAGRASEAVEQRPVTAGGREDRPRAPAEPIIVSANAR